VPITLSGIVATGYGAATPNLRHVMHLIEARSGLKPLVPGTLNVRLTQSYRVVPDFVVTRAEYNQQEEIRFQLCTLAGIPCLIMRPDSHELGFAHGPAHLEIMSTENLRQRLRLSDGIQITVEVP